MCLPCEMLPQAPQSVGSLRPPGPGGSFTNMVPLPSLGHIRSWLCSPKGINAKDWPGSFNLLGQVCHLECLISSPAPA